MSSKTKIIVLHMKEVVYTAVFLALALILLVVFLIMFSGKKDSAKKPSVTTAASAENARYIPGIYTSTISLGNQTFDVQVNVEQDRITAISLNNLSETTAAMYPLMEPALDSIASQIYVNQTTEGLIYGEDDPLHLRTARLRDQSGARTGSKSFLRRILIFPWQKASKHSSAPKPFFCRASQNLIVCTNLDYLCFFPYFLFCFLQLVEFLSPELHARITRHTQVAARGYRNASDLRAIRQAGAFELLREKSPVERFQPF